MSSYDFGSVKCEIENKYRDLTVGIGRGWGGDGKYPHRAYLEWWDDNDELHMIHFTFPALDTLVKLLVQMHYQISKEYITGEDLNE